MPVPVMAGQCWVSGLSGPGLGRALHVPRGQHQAGGRAQGCVLVMAEPSTASPSMLL